MTAPMNRPLFLPQRQQFEVLLLGRRILAAEEDVEPADVVGVLVAEGVSHLVVDGQRLVALVGQGKLRPLQERHGQPDVHARARAYRVDGRLVGHDLAVGAAEEIAHRALDARMVLAIPGGADHQVAEVGRYRAAWSSRNGGSCRGLRCHRVGGSRAAGSPARPSPCVRRRDGWQPFRPRRGHPWDSRTRSTARSSRYPTDKADGPGFPAAGRPPAGASQPAPRRPRRTTAKRDWAGVRLLRQRVACL